MTQLEWTPVDSRVNKLMTDCARLPYPCVCPVCEQMGAFNFKLVPFGVYKEERPVNELKLPNQFSLVCPASFMDGPPGRTRTSAPVSSAISR